MIPMVPRFLTVSIVFVHLCGVALAQVQRQTSPDVSSRLLNEEAMSLAKLGSVRSILQALTLSGLQVGAVLAEEDIAAPVSWDSAEGGSRTAGELLGGLSERLPLVQVTAKDDALLVVSSRAAACLEAVSQPLGDVQLSGEAYEVLNQLARIAAGEKGPFPRGGIIGAGPLESRVDVGRHEAVVTLNGVGLTFLEALQAASRQVPSSGWLVTERYAVELREGRATVVKDASKRVCVVQLLSGSSVVQIATPIRPGLGRVHP